MGPLLQRVERAARAAGDIGRVHIGRWGEGSEHLHWWFMGRPARMRQLSDSFAAIWDDILPPVPDDDLAREPGGESSPRWTNDVLDRRRATRRRASSASRSSRARSTPAQSCRGASPAWGSSRRSRTRSCPTGRSDSSCCGAARVPRRRWPSSSPPTTTAITGRSRSSTPRGAWPSTWARPASRRRASLQATDSAPRRTWSRANASGSRWRRPSSAPKAPLAERLLSALDAAEAGGRRLARPPGRRHPRRRGRREAVGARGRRSRRRPRGSARRAAAAGAPARGLPRPCAGRRDRATEDLEVLPELDRQLARVFGLTAAGQLDEARESLASAARSRASLGGLRPHARRP